jgi:hypothetical protein
MMGLCIYFPQVVPPQAMLVAVLPSAFTLLRHVFNVSVIEIQPQFLVVRCGPFALRQERCIHASEIDQVFCTYGYYFKPIRMKHEHAKQHLQRWCALRVLLKNGRMIVLVPSVIKDEEAVLIEAQIEQIYGIKNTTIPGEAGDRF